ncbi:MAG: BadF/BadG/BcrA/BcrD ATPase family protein, partial [Desulfotignum sp.]
MREPKACVNSFVAINSRCRQALGICLGASTISVVHIRQPDPADCRAAVKVVAAQTHAHGSDPRKTLQSVLRQKEFAGIDRIAATGRRFRELVNLTTISEPEAVEYAYRYTRPKGIDCPAIVSAGGETFMVYILDDKGRISNVITGNKCASGTGEFFIQQLHRMDVTLEEAARWSATQTPYQVSGRCSVFCKSDCTHAINKGIPKSRVAAGLCRMMANKILELLKTVDKKNIMITGGSARNQMMTGYLEQSVTGLIIPEEAPYFEALG